MTVATTIIDEPNGIVGLAIGERTVELRFSTRVWLECLPMFESKQPEAWLDEAEVAMDVTKLADVVAKLSAGSLTRDEILAADVPLSELHAVATTVITVGRFGPPGIARLREIDALVEAAKEAAKDEMDPRRPRKAKRR